ncbi:hypothetical protein [Aeromonas media]|uniref:hypothetical protein n=1 Tax=Aeromonas media TaxID=651 RepID=UPI003D1DA308
MKITTNRLPSSHSNLLFWGADACNNRDLSKAVGRYDEKSDELYLAGEDDLSKKVQKLIDIGVSLRAHKHKNGNYFIADTFATPTSDLNESKLNELTEPEFKSNALSFSDFVKNTDEQPVPEQPKTQKSVKKDKKKSISETEQELIELMRSKSSEALIAATLAELKECY